MKTLNLKNTKTACSMPRFALIIICLIFFCLPKISRSQTIACNYLVSNGSACDLVVDIQYIDGGGICNTVSGITILSAGQYYANCGTCGTLLDVKVIITSVGGNATPSFDVDSSNPNDFDSSCNGVYADWHQNSTDIHN